MIENADADLTTMCHQLSSEVEGRTSAALEIIRLKESHYIERKSQLAERQALQNELNLYKEMLKKDQITYFCSSSCQTESTGVSID